MEFWKVLKYVLMVLFTLILVCGIILTQDETQQGQPAQQTGSKFNF